MVGNDSNHIDIPESLLFHFHRYQMYQKVNQRSVQYLHEEITQQIFL